MKRSAIVGLILVVVAAAALYWDSTAERRKAEQIIAAIERYREIHGRLPSPHDHELMKSLGFDLRAGWYPDFRIGEKGLYLITIVEGFDGPYWTYDSFSQMWRKDLNGVGGSDEKRQAEQEGSSGGGKPSN